MIIKIFGLVLGVTIAWVLIETLLRLVGPLFNFIGIIFGRSKWN